MSITEEINYKFIAIEGNIGVGKTTIAKKLSSKLNSTLVLEKFRRNYFLPLFYNDMSRYGLHVELSFLVDRFEDFRNMPSNQEMLVSDYFFLKTLIFAKINLDKHALKIFERVYNNFEESLRKPDLVIYLKREIPQLLLNIKNRDRINEKKIKEDYLHRVESSYEKLLNKTSHYKILEIDVSNVDLRKSSTVDTIISLTRSPYNYGKTTIKI